jgi:putative CocE/NonD family hydrolase
MSLVLGAGGTLTLEAAGSAAAPRAAAPAGVDGYESDPAKPVPFIDWVATGMPREYMTADQRFAARRPDVLVYQSEPLAEDVTLAGPVAPQLRVSTTGTDADFVVKLVDVFPDSAPTPADAPAGFRYGGHQQLVRGEPMRARYRESFETPRPLVPGQVTRVDWVMPDVNHTFRRGHRIMLQVQSSWFPLIDRNPQTFVESIFFAKPADYRRATMRVHRGGADGSRVGVMVLGGSR